MDFVLSFSFNFNELAYDTWRLPLAFPSYDSVLFTAYYGVSLSLLKGIDSKLILIFLVLGFTFPAFIQQIAVASPSVCEGEYAEILRVVELAPPDSVFLVPNVKLKYWVETMAFNVTSKPFKSFDKLLILVFETREVNEFQWMLPKAEILFNDKFIKAFLIPPR